MKRVFVFVCLLTVVFFYSNLVYAQSNCGETNSEIEKKGESLDAKYDDYKEDPIYKKMLELKIKMDAVTAEVKKLQEKYSGKLTEDEKKKYAKEFDKLCDKYSVHAKKYEKLRKELDAKIEKDLAEKYKDNPLYAKMIKTKKAYKELKTKYMIMNSEFCVKKNSLNQEELEEFKKNLLELKEKFDKAAKEYKEAKLAFEKSLVEDKAEEEESGEEKE